MTMQRNGEYKNEAYFLAEANLCPIQSKVKQYF